MRHGPQGVDAAIFALALNSAEETAFDSGDAKAYRVRLHQDRKLRQSLFRAFVAVTRNKSAMISSCRAHRSEQYPTPEADTRFPLVTDIIDRLAAWQLSGIRQGGSNGRNEGAKPLGGYAASDVSNGPKSAIAEFSMVSILRSGKNPGRSWRFVGFSVPDMLRTVPHAQH